MAEHLRGDKELESIYRQDYAKRHDLTDFDLDEWDNVCEVLGMHVPFEDVHLLNKYIDVYNETVGAAYDWDWMSYEPDAENRLLLEGMLAFAHNTIPPTRLRRYCCADLKECNGQGRIVVTGVRWAESVRRKNLHGVVNIRGRIKTTRKLADKVAANYRVPEKAQDTIVMNDDNDPARRMVEHCYRTQKTMLNPIVDWTDEDVWEYLNNIAQVPPLQAVRRWEKAAGLYRMPDAISCAAKSRPRPIPQVQSDVHGCV